MGWDVSYHPISEQEIQDWYFNRLEEARADDFRAAVTLAQQANMDEFYIKKYFEVLIAGTQFEANSLFDTTHGYNVAVIQGLFRTFFYLRGSSFSFFVEGNPEYIKYTKPWEKILSHSMLGKAVENKIVLNYCSGMYIPQDQVRELLVQYETQAIVKATMDQYFHSAHIDVFLKALRYSAEGGLGLLEATEVIEPNPFDLNQSQCYSDLYHCDTDGPILYHQTALQQLQQFEELIKP